MKSIRNAFAAALVVVVFLVAAAAVIAPYLPYLLAAFFVASLFYLVTKGR